MRVDKPQAQNTFNTILIAFFFLGSSNFLFIIFFRPSPIKYGTELTDVITKYELCEQKYNKVDEESLRKVSIEELLALSYGQKESLKNFRVSSKRAEEAIRMDKRFQSNGVYDNKKLVVHLDNMRMALKIRITQRDYLEYTKISIAKDLMDKIYKNSLEEVAMGQLVSAHLRTNTTTEVLVEGYRVDLPAQQQKTYNFSDKEIKNFIKEQVRQKIGFYIIGENVTGFIIKIPMNMGVSKIMGAVNFFLKQEKFHHGQLQSFMEQFYIQSENFTTTIEYKVVMDKWKKNGKKSEKNVDISAFFQIEELNKVEENEDNKFIFDNQSVYHKDFYPIGTTYYRVIVKNHNKEKLKKLTNADIKEYVIPTMIAVKNKQKTIAMAYDMQFKHNNGQEKLSSVGRTCSELKLPLYIFDTDSCKNKAVVMYDVYDMPYIFVVTNVKQKMSLASMDKTKVAEYIDTLFKNFVIKEIYLILFNIYYDKFKNQFKA